MLDFKVFDFFPQEHSSRCSESRHCDNRQKTGTDKACQPHFLKRYKQRHRVVAWVFFFFTCKTQVIPIATLDHVKTYVHEAGCVECKRLLNLRVSWLPTFIHIQAQTGRRVRLGVCIIIKHTSLLTSRAGEFCQTNYWQAATTTVTLSAREKTHRSQSC